MNNISILDESQTVLVTGGCGFIGHHFVEHVIKNTKWKIVIIDKLINFSSKLFPSGKLIPIR